MALYEVTANDKTRLIEAKSKQGARSYAAKDTIEVVRVTPLRVATLVSRGVKVETAIEDGYEHTAD
jgi:hypothetical protein